MSMCVVPPLYKNNRAVAGGCQNPPLVGPRAVETAGRDGEEEENGVISKVTVRAEEKATRETGSVAEHTGLDWKIFLSRDSCAEEDEVQGPVLATLVHSGCLRLFTYLSQA